MRKKGKEASGFAKYSASKTLAEKGRPGVGIHLPTLIPFSQAAWEVYHRSKESVRWDLTTLNPPYVSYQPANISS